MRPLVPKKNTPDFWLSTFAAVMTNGALELALGVPVQPICGVHPRLLILAVQ